MCAMYGCAVSTSAEPIDSNSRSLRVAARQRRRIGMGRCIGTGLRNVEFSEAIIAPFIESHPDRTVRSRLLPPKQSQKSHVIATIAETENYFFDFSGGKPHVKSLEPQSSKQNTNNQQLSSRK
jgi:hypothetical protein